MSHWPPMAVSLYSPDLDTFHLGYLVSGLSYSTVLSAFALTYMMPDTSTIDGNMLMSAAPTYGVVSPEAIVETMIFGTPIGRSLKP